METKQFLRSVLPSEGSYCVLGISPDKPIIQRFYETIDSAADAALDLNKKGLNSYFALSSFQDSSSRTTKNSAYTHAFFLDLDCGERATKSKTAVKPFPTQAAAIKALQKFCKDVGVPKPTIIVNSGRGLHVYWVLDKNYTYAEWHPVAVKLNSTCLANGLGVDSMVTADAARVLRVPRTSNYNSYPPSDVYVFDKAVGNPVTLAEFSIALGEEIEIPVLPSRTFTEEDSKTMDALTGLGNVTKSFSRIVAKTGSGKGCGQIAHALEEPNSLSYEEWTNALSIAQHCEERDRAVHLISKGYDNYSPEETEKISNSITTPRLCSTFEQANPAPCANCPLKGKIKTPISLGIEIKEASEQDNIIKVDKSKPLPSSLFQEATDDDDDDITITIPKYPYPYFRHADGGVYIRTKDDDGEAAEEEIFQRDLYIIKRVRDPVFGPSYVFRHHTKREGIRDFVVSGVQLSSKEEFRKAMGMNDIFLLRSERLMAYVAAWIRELQASQDEIEAKTQFGWTDDCRSFVLGKREVFADRIGENPPSGFTLQHMGMFEPKGDLEGWKKVTEFYNKDGFELHQYMFALSFGSPLMEFIPNISAGVFHVGSGESGFGKTTGMWGGASIWGNHKELVLDGEDTQNTLWNRAELYKNLPLYIDEVTNIPAKEMSNFLYKSTAGKQRNRMTNSAQNRERYRGKPWSLLVGTSANGSLLDIISSYRALPRGEAQRVFEARTEKLLVTPEEAKIAKELNFKLVENYGHAGVVYIQSVIKHLPQVKKLLDVNTDFLIDKVGLTAQNRIWAAQAACVITGAQWAKRCGLIDWDIKALIKWVIRKLTAMRVGMKDMEIDINNVIAQFYAEHAQSILRIKSTDDARKADPSGLDVLVVADAQPRYQWVARHEYDVNKLYLMVKPFKQYCVKEGFYYEAILELMFKELNGERRKIRMGKGTNIKLMPMDVIAIQWDREEAESHMESQNRPLFGDDEDTAD